LINYFSEDGDVYSWGSNSYGQLGLGHEKSTSSPKYISTFKEKQIVRISAGGSCSAALTSTSLIRLFFSEIYTNVIYYAKFNLHHEIFLSEVAF
jgi:hypothetical protein